MQAAMAAVHLRFATLTGAALLPLLPALGRLRIEVFAEWPYLYEGDEAYEREYLATYADTPGAAMVVAFAGEEPVGAATCQPMAVTHAEVRAGFAASGFDPADWCYFGESVLRRAFRGQGAGRAFFAGREAHARALGLRGATFCAVERDLADPRRPAEYRPLDPFWTSLGYTKHPEVACTLDWREPGQAAAIPHRLTFWTKTL
jgi:GNAT superfamily N-acetyltransferase